MKYRLSTLLLLIVIAALALGWYVDHGDRSRHNLVGEWLYPNGDLRAGSTTFELRSNGTFTTFRGDLEFEGTYSIDKRGCVVFHVTTRIDRSEFVLAISDGEPHQLRLNDTYECRCGFDNAGYLVVDQISGSSPLSPSINWEGSFVRK